MKLSRRTEWSREPSRLSLAIAAARRAGAALVDLTESNPTRCGFLDRAHDVALLGDARGVRYDPSPFGLDEARDAVVRYYGERKRDIQRRQVVMTASSSEAYSWLFKLLCDPGEAVLAPRPSYPLFPYLADLERVELLPYPLLRDERWRVDCARVEQLLRERSDVRALLLVHPGNPTGALVHPEDREVLLDVARRHRIALIVDEVFLDYARGAQSFAGSTTALCFVLSGLSKVALLPQVKLGWIVASGPGADEALARLELIADTFLSVSTAVQLASSTMLARAEAVQAKLAARLAHNLAIVDEVLAGRPALRRLPQDGGWYACIEVPRTRSDDEWCELLIEREGVIVHPGYFFDMEQEGVMVVSLLPEHFRDAFVRAARRWAEA